MTEWKRQQPTLTSKQTGPTEERKEWRLPNGILHQNPRMIPAVTIRDTEKDAVKEIQYWMYGLLDGCWEQPAIRKFDVETSNVIEESYYHIGQKNRAQGLGPSRILFAASTGEVIGEEWYTMGMQTRENEKPSTWRMDERTGVITLEEYWFKGKLHRIDGPAIVRRDPQDGSLLESTWYIDGVELPDQNHHQFEVFSP